MTKNKIIDIDSVFEDFNIDEHQVKRYTAMKRVNSEKGQAVHKKKSETLKKQYQQPGYKEYRREIILKSTATQEFKEAHAKGIKKRENNGWKEKNLEARKKVLKPIHTPYGDFESKTAAVEWMTNNGIPGALSRVSRGLNSDKKEFYYLNKQNKKAP